MGNIRGFEYEKFEVSEQKKHKISGKTCQMELSTLKKRDEIYTNMNLVLQMEKSAKIAQFESQGCLRTSSTVRRTAGSLVSILWSKSLTSGLSL